MYKSRLQRHIVSISKRNLIINKRATGRDQDKLDAENLEKT